jgi:hypothetical protein
MAVEANPIIQKFGIRIRNIFKKTKAEPDKESEEIIDPVATFNFLEIKKKSCWI